MTTARRGGLALLTLAMLSSSSAAQTQRPMTTKNEQSPAWAPDGTWFVFSSDRDAPANVRQNQLYLMRPNGGEAQKFTDAKDGVADFQFSPDGTWLVFRAGKSSEEQLWRMSVAAIPAATAEQITKGMAGVRGWDWAPDSERIYFTRDDTVFTDERTRRDKEFTVDIKNDVTPASATSPRSGSTPTSTCSRWPPAAPSASPTTLRSARAA